METEKTVRGNNSLHPLFFQAFKEFFLLRSEFLWSLDLELHVHIPSSQSSKTSDAFFWNSQHIHRLSTCGNFQKYVYSFGCRNRYLVSQNSLRKSYWLRHEEIVSPSLEHSVRLYLDPHVQISWFSLFPPHVSFPLELENLVRIHACWNAYLQSFLSAHPSFTLAYVARLFRPESFSLAFRARTQSCERAKHSSLDLLHLALASAGETFFCLSSRFPSHSLTSQTNLELGKRDRFLSPLKRCFQRKLKIHFNVSAPFRVSSRAFPRPKEILQHLTQLLKIK